MAIVGIIFFVALIGLVIYMIRYIREPRTDEIVVLKDSVRGFTSITSPAVLPTSLNQPEGIVFSYTGWLFVNDFTTGYGKERMIFSKGDCPGLYLDSTSNGLVIKIKTYGTTETILISNIPASKWIHFAIVVNQESVDIYINGTLRQHHTLGQLPDQNQEAVKTGSEWSGVLGRVSYYARSLSATEIRAKSMEARPPDLVPKVATPNYFDITWYIGRLNSSS
jgi:hypothetical protein